MSPINLTPPIVCVFMHSRTHTLSLRRLCELAKPTRDEIVDLLSQGADVNGLAEENLWYQGSTLHVCARNHNAGLIPLLVHLGARIEQTDGVRDTPLATAVRHNHEEAARVLLEHGALFCHNHLYALTLLHKHCRRMVALLVEWGVDVHSFDEKDYRNPTWLNDTILLENFEAARTLMELGANPFVQSFDNYNAFRVNVKMQLMFCKYCSDLDRHHLIRRTSLLNLI